MRNYVSVCTYIFGKCNDLIVRSIANDYNMSFEWVSQLNLKIE